MIFKYTLLTLLFISPLFAFEQLVVVIADTMDSTTAIMQRYELIDESYHPKGETINVNLGRNGLAWRKNSFIPLHNVIYKQEGDGRSPAGLFKLNHVYGYENRLSTSMPYTQSSANLICVDDSTSPAYNTLRTIDSSLNLKSFEWMRRDDNLYKYLITTSYNEQHIPHDGSCIFLHVQRGDNSPTSGCTSMKQEDIKTIISWLDPKKKPMLLQIPRDKCLQYQHIFNGIKCFQGAL